MMERNLTLSELFCPTVDAVVYDLLPFVRSFVEDRSIELPRDWPLMEPFMKFWKPWLLADFQELTAGEQMVVYRRIERLLEDEAKERRRLAWLRVWFYLRVWLGALLAVLAIGGFVNGGLAVWDWLRGLWF